MDIVKCKTNIDYLIDNIVEDVRGGGEQESLFIVERTKESSNELCEQAIPETNIQTEIQMIQTE